MYQMANSNYLPPIRFQELNENCCVDPLGKLEERKQTQL